MNGYVTCAFSETCPLPWQMCSIYCRAHHREAAYAFIGQKCPFWNEPSGQYQAHRVTSPIYRSPWSNVIYRGLLKRISEGEIAALAYQPTVMFFPKTDTFAYRQLRFLHFAMLHLDVLLGDFEFLMLRKPNCVVPHQGSVRNASTGLEITGGHVEYHTTIAALAETVCCYTGKSTAAVEDGLRRRYSSDLTHGKILAKMGVDIFSSGFSADSHIFLSWFSEADVYTFARSLMVDNEVITEKTKQHRSMYALNGVNSLQPINVGYVFQELTDLASTKQSFVHQSLNDVEPGFRYHDAPQDTLSFQHNLKKLVATTEG